MLPGVCSQYWWYNQLRFSLVKTPYRTVSNQIVLYWIVSRRIPYCDWSPVYQGSYGIPLFSKIPSPSLHTWLMAVKSLKTLNIVGGRSLTKHKKVQHEQIFLKQTSFKNRNHPWSYKGFCPLKSRMSWTQPEKRNDHRYPLHWLTVWLSLVIQVRIPCRH